MNQVKRRVKIAADNHVTQRYVPASGVPVLENRAIDVQTWVLAPDAFLANHRRSHGFLKDGATFTTINVPGATDTIAFGINDAGQIVGRQFGQQGSVSGFLATPQVPEPSTWLLFGLGLVGLVSWRRRPTG